MPRTAPTTRLMSLGSIASLLLPVALAAGCGGGDHGSRTATGSPRSSGPGGSTVPVAPVPAGGSATTGSGSGPLGTGSGSTPPGAATTERTVAARQALDAYVGAIAGRDAATMLEHSTGAAEDYGSIRLTIAAIKAAKGATTTVQVANEALSVASSSTTSVTFNGSLTLEGTVSGAKGSQHSTDTLGGPVSVVFTEGAWRVSTFIYDGAVVRAFTERATQVISGLHFTVAFVLTYGTSTVALVGLAADSGHVGLALQTARLTSASGTTSGTGDFTTDPSPSGIIRFPRTDTRPSHLDATFRRADGGMVSFSLTLKGTAP